MLFVKGDGYAPFKCGSRNAQVFKSGLDKVVYKLLRPCFGSEVICFKQKFFYTLRKGGHFKEVGFFSCFLDLAVAFGTAAVFIKLGFRPEAFTRGAVLALVFAFVDIAFVVQVLEDFLYSFHVVIVGSAYIAVVADVHIRPEVFKNFNDIVNVLLRGNSFFRGLFFYFLTVLVGSRKEHNVIALHTFVARNRVAGNGGIAMPDMGISRGVVNGRGDVKGFV